jgi:hypothetical protein
LFITSASAPLKKHRGKIQRTRTTTEDETPVLTPTLRFLALPLGTAMALIALAMQPAGSRRHAEITFAVREQVVDCSPLGAEEVCLIGEATGS